jgi:hypothetical protein
MKAPGHFLGGQMDAACIRSRKLRHDVRLLNQDKNDGT